MIRISQAGFAGTTVSFVNFKNELPYFIDNVFPLLREAGLRS
jgi:alkanesulfonate monooxygenase SsuD/methylene tetrahydromethanopterin reductase-like flavin-dependent oxidoreductase (luciferase family)